MLGRKSDKSAAKWLKYIFIGLFVCALSSLFLFGNFLMINRPRTAIASQGYVYPFIGKGGAIYISTLDYGIVIGSLALLVFSMIAANRYAKIESQ
jgi:hypothetical protein